MATSAVEDYLKQILLAELKRPGQRVGMGKIAGAMDLAPGTVTTMVKTLAGSGLLDYEPYSGVRLTESGRQLATHVLRRHRLIEVFLVRVMGIDWSEVHPEAERLEHAVSDHLVERMDEMLGYPEFDPHGDPIPSAHGEVAERSLLHLAGCRQGDRVRVSRIADQSPEFLQLVERQRLKPGSVLTVENRSEAADSLLVCDPDGKQASLGLRAAAKILVEKIG